MDCPDFLDKLGHGRRCVEEFIKEMPRGSRDMLSELVEIINKYIDIEAKLLSLFDQYYLILLSKINIEIDALQTAFSVITIPYTQLKSYWSKYQSCPGVAGLAQYLEDAMRNLTASLEERLARKSKIFRRVNTSGARNSDLLLKQFLVTSTNLNGIQDFLSGFSQCLQKGIPSINPPFTDTM